MWAPVSVDCVERCIVHTHQLMEGNHIAKAFVDTSNAVSWPLRVYTPITKHSSALYIGMAKVLPIIDVLGYDGQNSSFSSSRI